MKVDWIQVAQAIYCSAQTKLMASLDGVDKAVTVTRLPDVITLLSLGAFKVARSVKLIQK